MSGDGGWVVGAPETHRTLCSCLAATSGWRVLSVRYDLAPEHAFPAQKVSAVMALNAVAGGRVAGIGVPSHLVLAGDSAGAAVALWAEAGAAPAAQAQIRQVIALYGAFGLRRSDSISRLGPSTPGLSERDLDAMYARLGDKLPPDFFTGLKEDGAPITAMRCGLDPLADDTTALMDWCDHIVRPATLLDARDMTHGFLHMAGRSDDAAHWMARVAGALPG